MVIIAKRGHRARHDDCTYIVLLIYRKSYSKVLCFWAPGFGFGTKVRWRRLGCPSNLAEV